MLTLALGYVSLTHSLADVVKRVDPAKAHALNPGNGRVTALLAERSFAETPSGDQSATAALARLAVREDATAVPAVATLGFQAQLRGDNAGAARLFAYAEALSRRHLQTQLWGIEAAVARGDVPGALRHYDVALRTNKVAPDLLFPVLSTAIGDPAIRSGLVPVIARQPSWAPAFVAFLATGRNDPRATAELFTGLRRAGAAVPVDQSSRVVDRLIEANAPAEAWRYYALVHPGVSAGHSRNPDFINAPGATSMFDWKLSDDPGLTTSIQRGENGGVLDFFVSGAGGGVLVQQMQMLPPGSYRLIGRSVGIEKPEQTLPYWALTCRDGREIGRVTVTNSAKAEGAFAGGFQVPDGCVPQTLSLIARLSDDAAGLTGRIDRIQLMPLR